MFYSIEQEITHYSRGKLRVGQITVREFAHSTTYLFEIGALSHVEPITSYFPPHVEPIANYFPRKGIFPRSFGPRENNPFSI